MRPLPDVSLVAVDLSPPANTSSPVGVWQRVNPLETTDWDDGLKDCDSVSFFHTAAWAHVLQSTYGYTPLYYTLRVGDRLRSVLPVMEVNTWLTSKRGVSLPFTDDCEPVNDDALAFRQLFRAALEEGTARRWKSFEVRGGKQFFPEAPASTSFYGHWVDLTGPESVRFGRIESNVRRAIRKAKQSGLQIEFATDKQALLAFFQLQCLTRKRHGVPPPPFHFFQNIQRHILAQNLGFIVVARSQRVPVAAAVFFQFGKNALFKYGASDARFQQQRANNLVMWEAIQWHARHGFEQLHLGRTSLANEGLRRFKRGWGSTEYPIEYVKYDCRQKVFVITPDESTGWHNRVFNYAPVGFSRLIGAALYKHVA